MFSSFKQVASSDKRNESREGASGECSSAVLGLKKKKKKKKKKQQQLTENRNMVESCIRSWVINTRLLVVCSLHK